MACRLLSFHEYCISVALAVCTVFLGSELFSHQKSVLFFLTGQQTLKTRHTEIIVDFIFHLLLPLCVELRVVACFSSGVR